MSVTCLSSWNAGFGGEQYPYRVSQIAQQPQKLKAAICSEIFSGHTSPKILELKKKNTLDV